MHAAPGAARSLVRMTTTQCRRRISRAAFAAAIAIAAWPVQGARAADTAAPCSAPEARQFDFWLGDWDAAWVSNDGKPARGTNRVEKILDGCVVAEAFDEADPDQPLHGRSYSVWDAKAKLWRQTWVDNSGGYLDFAGGLEGDRMILRRNATLADGRRTQQRMIFYSIAGDRFDWDWERSTDGGRSWELTWRIRYTRRASAP